MAQEQLELREASGNEKPVFGISEWMCYYANYDKPCPGPKALAECVDLHLQAGCDHLVWNLGRSVVDYWSELPHITRMCENGDQVGGISWSFVRKVMDEVCPLRHALVRGGSGRRIDVESLSSDPRGSGPARRLSRSGGTPTRQTVHWRGGIQRADRKPGMEGRHSLRTEVGNAAL